MKTKNQFYKNPDEDNQEDEIDPENDKLGKK